MESEDADGTERLGDRAHVSVAHEQPNLYAYSVTVPFTIHTCAKVSYEFFTLEYAGHLQTRIGCVCKLFIFLVMPSFPKHNSFWRDSVGLKTRLEQF